MTPFRNRADAGRELAALLADDARNHDAIVLALPRGGVPVGYEIARELQVPMDVVLVRKLGVPGREELAMGAVATSGVYFLDQWMVERLSITREQIDAVIERERNELSRREREYRGNRPPPDVGGMTVICVDDGLATGASMRAAVAAIREGRPARIIVAVPVAAPAIAEAMRNVSDGIVVARLPEHMRAVSSWYLDFSQTTDEEVRDLLARAR
ncbi:MAG TPA: phosphoribosyltransferase family protein [Candidatus Acidoferrales bacterium]|nr:phosphoribosyltransferase family protein [Candidatus Acidoferrales bacterium]